MDIVKKNWLSITCGVIAIIALVVAFVYPLDGMIEELGTSVKQRVGVQATVDGLLRKRRVAPAFDPMTTEQVQLTQFPSNAIIKQAQDALKAVKSDSAKSYDAAWKLNRQGHDLVVPGSLPEPVNQQLPIDFRRNLEDALNRLREEELVSGIPPTDEEKKKRADAIWKVLSQKIIVVDGKPVNMDAVTREFEKEKLELPARMEEEMATKKKMYVNPSAVMKVPASIPANGAPADPVGMWWAQVSYWVTADVVDTIKRINEPSANVKQSAVKNLLVLNVPESFFPPASNMAAAAAEGVAQTTGGLPDATLAVPEAPLLSPTKRISNNLYDVCQFTLAVDIEADKIPLFIKELATNRLITVIRFETFPVDPQLKQIEGYVYGSKPVMTLVLDCEALFMREWTVPLMPMKLRTLLGVNTAEGAATR
jgi:hypothetical protein